MRKSRVLEKLRSGKPVLCTKTNLTDPRVVEIIGAAGYDCVWLCREHVANDWSVIENQIRAAKTHGMDSVVRVSKGDYSGYIKPLELDAAGIMVPHVLSLEEAESIISMTKFHPMGRRALDGGNADSSFGADEVSAYIAHSNREKFVMIQIEDPEVMSDLDAICGLEGIDIVFFGPADYSHALGITGDIWGEEIAKVRRRIGETCARHGKWAGTPTTPENLAEIRDEGYQFLTLGSDVTALRKYYATAHADAARAAGETSE